MSLKVRQAELGDSPALAALFTELGFPASESEISARLARTDDIGLVAVLMGMSSVSSPPMSCRFCIALDP